MQELTLRKLTQQPLNEYCRLKEVVLCTLVFISQSPVAVNNSWDYGGIVGAFLTVGETWTTTIITHIPGLLGS